MAISYNFCYTKYGDVMKKVILIDGNNLLFRSYYATAYSGSILRNSKGFPTNALYGFINMLNKIINEEEPTYMAIAFDKGKTFRHEKYENYKDGRAETPEDLKKQFPVAKQIAKAMGIKCFEIDNYEADDIIGTFAKAVDLHEDFIATIISSDKDLLQLISDDVEVKLLKSSDFIRMNKKTFFDTYGISPEKMVDLKALMGDASDNIPGVKGVGEKTALNLLHEFGSLEAIYNNLSEVKGKLKDKLTNDKENAFFSYELATIYKDVPIDTNLENIKYNGITNDYVKVLEEYEFFSLLKKMNNPKKEEKINYLVVEDIKDVKITKDFAIFMEVKGNYHDKNILGISIYNEEGAYFIPGDKITSSSLFDSNLNKYTYDLKKMITCLKYKGIKFDNNYDDLMIASYLLNYNIKDDIYYLMNILGYDTVSNDTLFKDKNFNLELLAKESVKRAKFIFENKDGLLSQLEDEKCLSLYKDIEMPLVYVLSDMEYTGVRIDADILIKMKEDIAQKLIILEEEIHTIAGSNFNILSPKQLGKILFEDLQIPYPRKIKNNNYSTSADILNKLTYYPIVRKVLEYRMLSKLYSNYAVGLIDCIREDGKIHTIFNQTLTRTGRLSSTNPNLQNIPTKEEYSRLIRKAFVASPNNVIISSDYSQIELRIFAHMSNANNLIEAFKNGMDIHTKTAMDIFHVEKDAVTKNMRRSAKAVNFGILYGISSFGLSEDLGIDVKDAKKFIEDYLKTYPGIKDYMDKVVKDAHEKGYVKTLFGRKRIIDELKNSNYVIRTSGERMALNTPIQGTSADILKKAMIEIYNEFNNLGLKSKMIIQVHDELLIDTLEEEQEKVEEIIKNIMENTYKLNVPLQVEISSGKNWYEAK